MPNRGRKRIFGRMKLSLCSLECRPRVIHSQSKFMKTGRERIFISYFAFVLNCKYFIFNSIDLKNIYWATIGRVGSNYITFVPGTLKHKHKHKHTHPQSARIIPAEYENGGGGGGGVKKLYSMILFFFFLFWSHHTPKKKKTGNMWDLTSLTRGWTYVPCSKSMGY